MKTLLDNLILLQVYEQMYSLPSQNKNVASPLIHPEYQKPMPVQNSHVQAGMVLKELKQST